MTKTYALAGAAGFVAPRHMRAIHETGGKLIAAVDPNDSVGILDRYSKSVEFFTEPARFERWLYKHTPDFLVVCTPNHLHETYVRMGLQAGCDVICEKPLVLNPENLDLLEQIERMESGRVYTVLQLRLGDDMQRLRKVCSEGSHTVTVRYYTPRGPWYRHSWKGDTEKSGGIITNIGVHLFDILTYLFGRVEDATHYTHGLPEALTVCGRLKLARADVEWELSIDPDRKPERTFFIDDEEGVDLTGGFDDAHTRVYEEILAGRGWGIADARPAIELCWSLRNDD